MALEDYNWADRMVHRLAFGSPVPQSLLCDLEAKQSGTVIGAQPINAPIFVTGLPRAGTTLLLEVLSRHPALVTHSYRDMPFVLSPVIWRRLSAPFHVRGEVKERSHGDGLMVNADSPEAFEEVLWLKHFPGHYGPRGIAVWDALDAGFTDALSWHMKALIVSRRGKPDAALRYLSKNNANIARLPHLQTAFPSARVIIPLRPPRDHALSLLRQHQKALKSHDRSRFARAYPRDIGHFEFGANHRPILFEGMEGIIERSDPMQLDYWLGYWIAAHRHLQSHASGEFIDMIGFTADRPVNRLFDQLNLPSNEAAASEARAMIRPISSYPPNAAPASSLLAEAEEIYDQLRATAIRLPA